MANSNEPSKSSDEVGNELVSALGFEPVEDSNTDRAASPKKADDKKSSAKKALVQGKDTVVGAAKANKSSENDTREKASSNGDGGNTTASESTQKAKFENRKARRARKTRERKQAQKHSDKKLSSSENASPTLVGKDADKKSDSDSAVSDNSGGAKADNGGVKTSDSSKASGVTAAKAEKSKAQKSNDGLKKVTAHRQESDQGKIVFSDAAIEKTLKHKKVDIAEEAKDQKSNLVEAVSDAASTTRKLKPGDLSEVDEAETSSEASGPDVGSLEVNAFVSDAKQSQLGASTKPKSQTKTKTKTSEAGKVAANEAAVAFSPTETTQIPLADVEAATRLKAPFNPGFQSDHRERSRTVQARKVRRVIRHIDPWSVLQFAVTFHLVIFAALLLASMLIWGVAESSGYVVQAEDFIQEVGGFKSINLNGGELFRAAAMLIAVLSIASTVGMVLMAVVFNLISDLVGGIRITVVEEETVRLRPKTSEVDNTAT